MGHLLLDFQNMITPTSSIQAGKSNIGTVRAITLLIQWHTLYSVAVGLVYYILLHQFSQLDYEKLKLN